MKLNIQLFADGKVVIDASINTKEFDRQIAQLEYELEDLKSTYDLALKDPDWDKQDLMKMETQIEKMSNKLGDMRKKQLSLNQATKEYGNATNSNINKIGKWGLAIFGIRSAYMLIRQATNQIAQENDDIANKLNAIKGSLTNLLAPVVETIVNLVYRLLSYLNVITTKFLGIDLFKKTAKSGKSAVGSANKLKKQLAGFDEMNVLSDTSGGGAGGGGTSTLEPPDTSKFAETIEKFQEMWNELLAIDREDAKKILLNGDKTWGLFKLGWFDTIQGIARFIQGIVDVVKSVFQIIQAIAEGDEKKIKDGVDKLVLGIFGVLSGIGQFLFGIGEMAVGIVFGFLKEIYDGITNIFTKIVNIVSKKIESIKKTLTDKFGAIGTAVGNIFGDKFRAIVNGVLSAVEGLLNKPINQINNLIGKINAIPGISLSKLSTFKFPRLAKGGIINQPGRGTYVGGAIAGESGREAVLPLQNTQVLQEIADAIGSRITINANIVNSMNGRIISRELQKINNENAFAGNR